VERTINRLRRKFSRVGPLELILIVALAAVARLFALFLLPNSPSSFGPDEGTYAYLAEWVEEGEPVTDFPAYGAGLYNSARSLILPSVIFIRIGFEPLIAVRFTSLIYGVLSIYVFAKLVLYASKKLSITIYNLRKKLLLIVSFFAFLPSPFIWSILGLRETASAFWIMMSAISLIRLKDSGTTSATNSKLTSWPYQASMALISIILAFGARQETALVFLVFFGSTLIFLASGKRLLIASICVMGFIGGHLFTMTPGAVVTGADVSGNEISNSNSLSRALVQSPLREIIALEYKRNGNTLNANTALPLTQCHEDLGSILTRVQCNLKELPYRLVSVLFRPFVFLDTGSISNNLASLENLIWLALLGLFLFGSASVLKDRVLIHLTLPAIMYVISFASLLALYEGNLGTAFRHKSTILWPILYVIFLSILAKPSKRFSQGVKI